MLFPLDTDINVPLYIRGPGIPEDKTFDVVSSHTDLAPTFLGIAGSNKIDGLDGKKIPFDAKAAGESRAEHAAIEYWGAVSYTLILSSHQPSSEDDQ